MAIEIRDSLRVRQWAQQWTLPDALLSASLLYLGLVGGLPNALRSEVLKLFTLIVMAGTCLFLWKRPAWSPVQWPILAFGLAFLIATAFRSEYAEPTILLAQWSSIALATAAASQLPPKRLRGVLVILLGLYAAAALFQLGQWAVVHQPGMPLHRLPSILWNPNNFAFVLLIALFLSMRFRAAWLVLAVLGLLILTGSRVNWAAAAIGLVVYMGADADLRQWLQKGRVIVLAIIPTVLVGGYIAYRTLPQMDATVAMRAEYWKVAARLFLQRPLTGWGGWSIYRIHAGMAGTFTDTYTYAHSHSLPLNLMAEGGLPALAALIFLGVVIARQLRQSPSPEAWAFAAAMLISNLFDYYYWVPACGMVAAIYWLDLMPVREEVQPLHPIILSIITVTTWTLTLGHDYTRILY
jgi:O-antigen ligase